MLRWVIRHIHAFPSPQIVLACIALHHYWSGEQPSQRFNGILQFQTKIFIGAGCLVAAATLDFGTNGVLAHNVDASSLVSVSCTSGTVFQLGLDKGTAIGATRGLRYMTGPAGAKMCYALFSDYGRASNWGEVFGVDTVAGTNIDIAQNHTG